MPLGPFNNIYGMGASPVIVGDLLVLACDQSLGSYPHGGRQAHGPRAVEGRSPRSEERPLDADPVARPGRQGSDPRPRIVSAHVLRRGHRPEALVGRRPVVRDEVHAGDWRRHDLRQRLRRAGQRSRQQGRRCPRPTRCGRRRTPTATACSRRRSSRSSRRRSGSTSRISTSNGTLTHDEWAYYRAALDSENGMLAIRLGGSGDMTDKAIRWKYQRSVPQLPSPLLYSGVLYMVNDNGIITTLNPGHGRRHQAGPAHRRTGPALRLSDRRRRPHLLHQRGGRGRRRRARAAISRRRS